MAITQTANFNLSKPDDAEFADVDLLNANWDIVDTELDRVDDEVNTEVALRERFMGGIRRTTADTATSGATEKVFITAPSINLTNAKTYRVKLWVRYVSSATAQHFVIRLREDNLTGTVMADLETRTIDIAGAAYVEYIEFFYTAAATAGKVFVGTINRQSGAGTGTVQAQTHLTVEELGVVTINTV